MLAWGGVVAGLIAASCARGIGGMSTGDWLAFGGFVLFCIVLVVYGAWESSPKRSWYKR